MTYLLIFIALFSAFFIALVAGFLTGIYLVCKIESEDDNDEWLFNAYCFECEIEMPVKEKNGRLHCSNCGLRH
ncbi:hypothetical protein NJT12_20765 [Flavobacterium sp. AC]|uniref:Phage protein n=1 Tax=Flavobacterium azizsancarii TaxID=2961580 RepID=A0ABT4WIN5_9FLAO|nr:hypothetical protein [Flavobacterium azizsancarii]MDA6072062.1 hypothetical protein [Flavobacterium azizsancarii]